PGLLEVRDLAADRQDGLEAAVAALLGGAPGRIALDDEDLAVLGVVERAVGELPRQRAAVENGLAPRQVARLARRLAGAGGGDHLLDDLARDGRILLEVLAQPLAHHRLDRALDLAVAELRLRLPLELRVL